MLKSEKGNQATRLGFQTPQILISPKVERRSAVVAQNTTTTSIIGIHTNKKAVTAAFHDGGASCYFVRPSNASYLRELLLWLRATIALNRN